MIKLVRRTDPKELLQEASKYVLAGRHAEAPPLVMLRAAYQPGNAVYLYEDVRGMLNADGGYMVVRLRDMRVLHRYPTWFS